MAEKKVSKKAVKEEMNLKQNSSKRYIMIALIVLAVILLGIYFYKWYDVKKQEKLSTSYLISTDTVSLEIKNLDELKQIMSEAPSEYFVLISYTGSEKTYELEQGLKDIIDSYSLSDRFYYYDATKLIEEDNYLEMINNAFNTNEISGIPVILYYKDGVLANDGVILREDGNPINAGDFQKLLDIYEFEGQ